MAYPAAGDNVLCFTEITGCWSMPDAASAPTASVVARFPTEAGVAQAVIDQLADSFDSTDAVVTAFEDARGRWTIAIHFRDRPNATAVRALVALAAGTAAANALSFETIAAKDWVKASLEGLSPVVAGRFVVHGAHDRARVPINAIGIEIEAALAFGTGHHGSTRGCLLALDWIAKARRPRTFLDLGTGSGVLAIAAAKALHRPVLASDIDAVAVRAARDNARRNRAGITVVHAAGLAARSLRAWAPFDLVLANILLGPLQRLAAPMAKLLAPGARVVLSGLLTSQVNAALAAYRAHGLALERRIQLGGWATLVLRRCLATSPAGRGRRKVL
jgi:ribosomal protein L11 methyltransferase